MNKSKIIVLNGVSSSGKTTVGRAIQNIADERYLLLGFDTVFEMLDEKSKNEVSSIDFALKHLNMLISELAEDGANLIIDHILVREMEIRDLLHAVNRFQSYFVKISCDQDIIRQREGERKDRIIGLADMQIGNIDKHLSYDFSIDTSDILVDINASKILEYIRNNPQEAFYEMCSWYCKS